MGRLTREWGPHVIARKAEIEIGAKRPTKFDSLFCTVLRAMSAPKAESTRRRKAVKEDEDYVPEDETVVAKKTKSTKSRHSPFVSHVTPYNPRHHDPTIARLGIPTQGTIRNFLLSQVALSTRIITWLHVRPPFLPVSCPSALDPNSPMKIFRSLRSLHSLYASYF